MSKTIQILIDLQELCCLVNGTVDKRFTISTSTKGAGQKQGSNQTPLGEHVVRAKIGDSQAMNTVFVGRRPTGEIWSEALHEAYPARDWILTRILWLSGKEPGFNRLGEVDTMRRYIYVHGTPHAQDLGRPGSHGCIRMSGSDVVELFDWTEVGTPVSIIAGLAS